MNKDRKTLKEYSIVILALALFSLVRMVVDVCVFGFDTTGIVIEGATPQLIRIAGIIAFALAIVLLIPNVFVGVRGINESKNPSGKKGHIVWSLVLAILALIALVFAVIDIIKGYNLNKLIEIADIVLDVAIFGAYYSTAKKVAKSKE